MKIHTRATLLNRVFLAACISMGWCAASLSKVLIFTYAFNRPDFIEMQYKTFQAFLEDEFEYVVFSDAREPLLELKINQKCEELGIRCMRIPPGIHTPPGDNCPSTRNGKAVDYSLEMLGYDHDDILMLVDSDLFLVKKFNIRKFLGDADLAGYPRTRKHLQYLWIGIAMIHMPTLPNKRSLSFALAIVDNTLLDAGGYTYNYIKDNPEAKVMYFDELCLSSYICENLNTRPYDDAHTFSHQQLEQQGYNSRAIGFIKEGPTDMEFFIHGTFLHYCGASNWARKSTGYHLDKSEILNTYITRALADLEEEACLLAVPEQDPISACLGTIL